MNTGSATISSDGLVRTQQKLDRLDEAFLFAQSIDASYEWQRDRVRGELTRAQIGQQCRRPSGAASRQRAPS